MAFHNILERQLNHHFQGSDICHIESGSNDLGNRFSIFLQEVSNTYSLIDRHYALAKHISDIAKNRETSSTLFELFGNECKDILTIQSSTGQIVYNSPAVKKILGYSPSEFLSPSFDIHIHPDDILIVQQARKSAVETREGQLYAYRVESNGRWVWIETSSTLSNSNPNTLFIVSCSRIIPLNTFMGKLSILVRVAERLLREVKATVQVATPHNPQEWSNFVTKLKKTNMLITFVENSSNEIFEVIDTGGKFCYCSPACRTLLGYSPEELIGQSDKSLIFPSDRVYIERDDDSSKGASHIQLTLFRRQTKSGKYIWMERASFAYWEAGTLSYYIGIERDAKGTFPNEPHPLRHSNSKTTLAFLNEASYLLVERGPIIDPADALSTDTGRIMYISNSASHCLKTTSKLVIGVNILELCQKSEEIDSLREKIQRLLSLPIGSSSQIIIQLLSPSETSMSDDMWFLIEAHVLNASEIAVFLHSRSSDIEKPIMTDEENYEESDKHEEEIKNSSYIDTML